MRNLDTLANSTYTQTSRLWLYRPVSPHQVGQLLVSFTTPEANMSLNRSHLRSQNVTWSCWWYHRLRQPNRLSGATRRARNPVSSNRISLGIIKYRITSITTNVSHACLKYPTQYLKNNFYKLVRIQVIQ